MFGEAQNLTNSISRSRPHDYATTERIGLLDEGVDQHFRSGELPVLSCAMTSIDTNV
jgi:hypothetical protein